MTSSLLDPNQPWPWLLYALAGAAVSVICSPQIMRNAEPSDIVDYRDKGPRRVMHALVWLFWPLIAAAGLVRILRVLLGLGRGR